MKKFISIILILAMTLAIFSGCNASEKIAMASITLSETQIVLAEGEVHTIYAEISPQNADDSAVSWLSSNEDIATVSKGTITAKDTGSCKIYAKNASGDVSGVVDVVVSDNFLRVSSEYEITLSGYGSKYFATITEAIAVANEDSVVLVEEGEYSEIVNITKSVTLKGQNATITGAFVIGYPELSDDAEDIVIEGFTFEVGQQTGMVQSAGIYIGSNADDVTISSCTFVGDFEGVATSSVWLEYFANASTTASTSVWSSEDITVGIYAIPTASATAIEDIEISACTFKNLDYALLFMPYVAKSEIVNNTFQDCGYAMRLSGSKRIDVENNTLYNSGLIQFGYSDNLADYIVCENNNIASYPQTYLVEACEGTVNSGFTLDLSNNTFGGIEPADMTMEEFNVLASKIAGVEKDGMIENVKLCSQKELKKIYEG